MSQGGGSIFVHSRYLLRSWSVAAGWAAVILIFLATRLIFLDRDMPPWELAMYQPLDEAAYTIPAFNLHHYGTWTHQELPWIPVEGSPMNVLQSAAVALTLALDWTYWGFRASSVLFALVTFLAIAAVARRLVAQARVDGARLPFPPGVVLAVTVALLLVDLGFLLAGRVVEATTARIAVFAVLLWMISRGTFLGPTHNLRRTFVLGTLAGMAMVFVYVYNAFLIPGVVALVAWWAWQRDGIPAAVRHALVACAGTGVALVVYFAGVQLVYGDNPVEWYQRWLAVFRETGRAAGVDPSQLWELLLGNTTRLDRPLMVLVLAAVPIFAWWTLRSRDRLGMAVLAFGLAFVAQTMVQSDYPQRKMLVLLPLLVPLAVGGVLRFGQWQDWARAEPRRRWIWILWVAWVVGVAVFATALALPHRIFDWGRVRAWTDMPRIRDLVYSGPWGRVVAAGALLGVPALLVALFGWHRPRLARAAGVVLVAAMLGPLLLLDARYVFTHVTTTNRDAMIEAGSAVDGQVTAGELSYAMQLYNSSRAVLAGAVSAAGLGQGLPIDAARRQYDQSVARYFAEGRASSMYAYAGPDELARWSPLGFRLVGTLPMVLPNDRVMGIWVYDP